MREAMTKEAVVTGNRGMGYRIGVWAVGERATTKCLASRAGCPIRPSDAVESLTG